MKIKICGLTRLEDADYVNRALPDYAGFVFYPKSRRFLSDDAAVRLRERISPEITTVGVFVDDNPAHAASLCKGGAISIIQLHGGESEQYIARLRDLAPDTEIWKSFLIKSESDVAAANGSSADAVLLDNGYGSGKSFDWSLLNGIKRDYILAGGLTVDNIAEAAKKFNPLAVDISSGVETDGLKDEKKIAAAVAAIRAIK